MVNVKKIKKGMEVKTNYQDNYSEATYEVEEIGKNEDCSSGYSVCLRGVKCNCCGVIPTYREGIDAGWITEIVGEE